MSSCAENFVPLTGGCACSYIQYKVMAKPLIVHCCHCQECQAQTGSAFVINYLIEMSNVVLENKTNKPISVRTPSTSGYGQLIQRCPKCQLALWSYYGGFGPAVAFLRVGTLDAQHQDRAVPDVHIYTKTKMPWFNLPDNKPVFEEFYRHDETWSKESLAKREALKPLAMKWMAGNETFWQGQAEVVPEEKVVEMMTFVGL